MPCWSIPFRKTRRAAGGEWNKGTGRVVWYRMRIPRRAILALLASFLPVFAAAAPLTNRLANSPSPYLALHGADPVAWQEWSAETVERARTEGKLLYVSVGYFSCHWCHVIQRESYRNADIARFLNAHFIPVKVDRELDPALDAQLVEFAERTLGRSGWPLNVFVTPDGHPLYATLYHPPAELLGILRKLDELWRADPKRLMDLARVEDVRPAGLGVPEMNAARVRELVAATRTAILADADVVQGGFGQQSKFPQVPQLRFLLDDYARNPDTQVAEFLRLTLDAMAQNGLADHVGGGFFRYTVDPSWKTPHFEKMLYDNVELAGLYLDAARVLQRDDYRAIGVRTIDFMLDELRTEQGGFIAALSAVDDHEIEGGYYLWDAAQLESVLTADELAAYRLSAGMTDAPPFEHGWLPRRELSAAEVARRLKRSPSETGALLRSAEAKLRAARAGRGLPRDTKVIAAWNGRMLSTLVAAATITGERRYREAALALRDLLATSLWDGRSLARMRVGGRAVGTVTLEDYAYVAAGLADWALYANDDRSLKLAHSMATTAWDRFYGKGGWRFEEASLLAGVSGQDVISDGPMPSPSAVLIGTSLRLAGRTGDDRLRQQALAAANSGAGLIHDNPFWFATPVAVLRDAVGSARR